MELKTSLSKTRPTGFLDLPVELRRLIYQYCLVRQDPFIIPDSFIGLDRLSPCRIRDPKNGLLYVSKKIGAEALEVLWGDNFFQIYILGDGVCHLTGQYWEANRQRIRKLQVVMLQSYSYGCMPDSTPWSTLFAKLTNLVVVTQRPPQAERYYDMPAFEEDLKEWMEWMESHREILRCLSSELRSSCVIEVDDGDTPETGALMKECFPRGYRKVQTLAGNFLSLGSRCYTG